MYKHFFKRLFDILLSFTLLLILWPVFLIIAVAIKLDSKGPVLFLQERIGKGGKVFKIYKFRSMCVGAEHTGSGVYSGKGDARVTRVGRILRATSLDELIQVVNILKGDMSFIGPRPPLTYHPWPIEEYTEEQLRMFEVRPGITGYSQMKYRNSAQGKLRYEADKYYVDHLSFMLDVKIIFGTIKKVLKRSDIYNEVSTAQPETETQKEKVHK